MEPADKLNAGATNNQNVPYPNAWIRPSRADQTFTAYRGTNGVDWTPYARMTLTGTNVYPSTVYLGLVTTSHNNATNAVMTYAEYRNFGPVATASGPALSIAKDATGKVVITFEGTLQAAGVLPAVTWTDIVGTSPLTVTPGGAMQFCRAKQ